MSADPTGNLKDDLRQAAENTTFQFNKIMVGSTFATAKMIVDSRLADQTEIEKFKNFNDQWRPRNISFIHNVTQLSEFRKQFFKLLPKVPKVQLESRLDQYTRGSYSVMQSNVYDRVADLYEAFKTKAIEIIRVAKETGYTDNKLDTLFDKFARAARYYNGHDFDRLLNYLQSK